MNEKVLEKYKQLLQLRLNEMPLLNLGEDTIRYDFFCALAEVEKLQPHEIQIEYPMNIQSFIIRNNTKSKRKEKPQIDLVVEKLGLNLSVEFALFRQNSNEEGTINKTARTVKMLNDMIRLGLDSYHTKRKGYFICVADDKMLGHQLQSKIISKFPSDYLITMNVVNKQKEMKTCAFDDRFIKKFEMMKCSFKAKLIYNENLEAEKITRETRILVWELT